MKRLTYGILSSLVIFSAAMPVKAETPAFITAQSESTVERMFQQQRVLTEDIQSLMAQMKTVMAQMKALTSVPQGQSPTMADLYKQQQVMATHLETLLAQNRLDTIPPRRVNATVQEVYEQQVAMVSEMKTMMAEMKAMVEVYRGRVTSPRR